ncbi:N-acetylmuramoyl-L-alanine amidase [Clostridium sp. 19966]|uniref:peptidoglycan recognition protein family protein n=1 Tax=Clostridium sp. 19966 TaxID=2768166 RepID=UPI0028DE70C8|nr:N-acetylmuramoyl-L-alanine amidase [Clostridium sp. 19966]MDT8717748.1 N-acetylmuramoyl-L-alanine amidase [Clostridium sp. 19966]
MNIIESNLQWNGQLTLNNVPQMVVLHHAEATNCSIEDIDNWHKERGWIGCGYHFLVRKDGSIYRGRPENAEGAHCYGYNSNSIGVCFEGNYMADSMPDPQKAAGIELIKYILQKYNLSRIEPHRALYNTACPGDKFPFDDIKNAALNSQGSTVNYQPIQNRNWLQVGDTGDKVKDLQNKLIRLGYSLGAYGADGDYGKLTKNAVYKYQQDNGLQADGLAGQQTMSSINAKIAELDKPKPPVVNELIRGFQHVCNVMGYTHLDEDGIRGNCTNAVIAKILIQKGARNELVRWIQNRLISLGFSCGSCGADGDFGNGTLVAVQNFQASRGLSKDGIVGANTINALLK